MYVIFERSSNSLYSRIDSQICKDLRTYSNILGVTVADNTRVGIFGNVSFKCSIEPYFFWKLFQLQSKCALSTTIHANRQQNLLFRFCIVLCQKRKRGPSNTFRKPIITEYSFLSMRFQMPGSLATKFDISVTAKIPRSYNYCCWSSIRAIVGKMTKPMPPVTSGIDW